jgi:undecaprenyl-diphosphatase
LVAFAFHLGYIWTGHINLDPEEAQYWDWSRHPALSYYSKGPLVAHIIALFTRLGGNSEFFVRLPTVLIALGMMVLVYLLTVEMFGDGRAGFFSSLMLVITPMYAAGAVLMTTDPPCILFWALVIWAIYKALNQNKGWWYLAGVCFGLGFLAKYTMVALAPSILLYLLLSKEKRYWMARKEPYLALLIGLVLFLPVIFWNIQHNWVSWRHVLSHAGLGKGPMISAGTFSEFLVSQAGVISPFIFFAFIYGMWMSWKYGIRNRNEEYLLLACTSSPIFIFYLLLSLHKSVNANWAAPAYFTGFIATSAVFNKAFSRLKSKLKRKTFKSIVILSFLIALALTGIAYQAEIPRRLGVDVPKGWRELGKEVSRIMYEMEPANHTFIFSDRYQITSELAFYTDKHYRTYCVNLGRRQNQYDYWPGFYQFIGSDAIYVKHGERAIDPQIAQAFRSCKREPTFRVIEDGKKIRVFSIFRCYEFKGMERPSQIIAY